MSSLELKAPKGKFRVIGVDTFSSEDWIYDDLDTLNGAIELANQKGAEMLKTHVYDENGKHMHSGGNF